MVALVVAAALAVVVWVGISGRPTPPPIVADALPTPSASTSAAVATASPLPLELPGPTPALAPDPTPAAEPGDHYLINGLAGRTSFSTALREVSPDYLAGQLWLSDPPEGELLAFEISPPRTAARSPGDTLGTWLVNMDELASNHRAGISGHQDSVPARPRLIDAPLPIRRGFDIQISVRLAFNEVAAIDFEILLRQPPEREPIGDDGILGCRAFSSCFWAADGGDVRP